MSRTTTRHRRFAVIAAGSVLAAGGLAPGALATADGPPERTDPRVTTRNPATAPQVTDARYASHPQPAPSNSGFDRVVFDLRGRAAGYDVRYVKRLTECGSGQTVTVPGSHFLSVTLKPAAAHTASGKNTYVGPGRSSTARLNLDTVKSLRMICDLEGHVGFGLGLDHKAGFNAATLSNATRIYIDVAHQ